MGYLIIIPFWTGFIDREERLGYLSSTIRKVECIKRDIIIFTEQKLVDIIPPEISRKYHVETCERHVPIGTKRNMINQRFVGNCIAQLDGDLEMGELVGRKCKANDPEVYLEIFEGLFDFVRTKAERYNVWMLGCGTSRIISPPRYRYTYQSPVRGLAFIPDPSRVIYPEESFLEEWGAAASIIERGGRVAKDKKYKLHFRMNILGKTKDNVAYAAAFRRIKAAHPNSLSYRKPYAVPNKLRGKPDEPGLILAGYSMPEDMELFERRLE